MTFGGNTFFKNTATVDNISGDVEKIRIGKNTIIRGKLLISSYGGDIKIGDNVYIGVNSNIWSGDKIVIGDDVLISHDVNIIDTNSHEFDYNLRSKSYKEMIIYGHPKDKGSIETGQIIIENNVWISFGVSVLKNVTQKKELSTKSIDEFVQSHSDYYLNVLNDYYHKLLERDNTLLLRYEDMVKDYEFFLTTILEFIDVTLIDYQPIIKSKFKVSFDLQENKLKHVRKATPGEYRGKLDSKTIEFLNLNFQKILKGLGYD